MTKQTAKDASSGPGPIGEPDKLDVREIAVRDHHPDNGISEQAAAKLVGVSERHMQRMRVDGGGPPFCYVGRRVIYLRSDVLAWLRAQRVRSTSQSTERRRAGVAA